MTLLRIVIADDQTLFREGLQTIINLEADLQVVGVADNGLQALEAVRLHRPHVVLMDVEMPGMNGVEATRQIKAEFPDTHVLILSTFAEDEYIVEGLANGASGYLLKDLHTDALLAAIRDGARGQMMLPARIAARLAARLHQLGDGSPVPRRTRRPDPVELTEREREIGALMVRGFNNKEIAARLLMGEGTVRNYISVIYAKIGTSDRAKAILLLREHGL